ncbi:hypothetical protein J4G43_025885 [Bradyrhizobium barranii subsp. barranii]|uniref:Uncharacterized protein n=1 Tax=Bradyrhizobium barranii subsp. barranii TaxID=2823807 RepID=A0A939S2L3_9BRAD|nr:hypothetical protein [Bradyrhizobium barranii]UEM08256.1 hypothetical protein J4G43_025885 [Bradyrhizobium barranii subsp. barranii]
MIAGFNLAATERINRITWRRHPSVCRAHQQMLVAGAPNGLWIRGISHPTALRPYYVVMPDGQTLDRKFARLVDAKAEAIIELARIQACHV